MSNDLYRTDPFRLDESELAAYLQLDADEQDATQEPPHPLLDDPFIERVFHHYRKMEERINLARHPNGEMPTDAYYVWEEGIILRPEVFIKIIVDFIKKNPQLLKKSVPVGEPHEL